ncbi:MAG: hypothetical protein PHI84_20235 [Kiritimatiellae bacterium]|nr:hypothetical protein [Kiritimatiellia bacterium]
MMKKMDIKAIVKDPVFKAGVIIQGLCGLLLALLLVAIRMRWLDIVKIGLETPFDEPSPKLDALMWIFRGLTWMFVSGFGFYAVAVHRQERKGSPNKVLNRTVDPAGSTSG